MIHLCLAPSTNLSADEIVPDGFYELSNKEISKRHFSFLIQGAWGKSSLAHSWMDNPAESGYNRKAAQWKFVKATGEGPNDYWIVNRATGGYLAETRTDKEYVDVAGKGAHGSVWTVVLFKDGTHYKIINKASTYGLFQKSDGNEWDVHVWWKGDLNRDAFLWHAVRVEKDPPAEPIKPGSFYRLSNKELSKRHDSFLIQGNYGFNDNAAHSWWEYAGDRGYRSSAYEWRFVRATGEGTNDYWIVNRATGKYLAQTNTNAWDVDVADKGAHGSVWTVVLNEEGTHYKINNKASGLGLFQKDWGYEWDVHVWKDNPDHDAYLWKIQAPSTIPTVTILSVKCIHPSTGIDGATKALFQFVDIAVQTGIGAATGGGSVAATMTAQAARKNALKIATKEAIRSGAFKQAANSGGKLVVMAGKSSLNAAGNLLTKDGMKEFAKAQVTKKALAERAADEAKEAALEAGDADSLSELAFKKLYGTSPDDLAVYVNGIKRWPDVDSRDITSQQIINLGLTIPYDPRLGFVIELKDYDSGSADDGIGWMYWSPEAIRSVINQPGSEAKVFVSNRDEGSLYEIRIRVGTGFDQK